MDIDIDFSKSSDGLIPAIVQDAESNEVLMLAYVNKEAFDKSLQTGKAHYWSRSRQSLWLKGESSGHTQDIRSILVDCDKDTIIYRVVQHGGAACHTGHRTCFFHEISDGQMRVVGEKIFDPEKVYGKK